MKYISLLGILFLIGCGSDPSADQLAKFQEQMAPKTATAGQNTTLRTTAFSKNQSYFYEKELMFTLSDTTLTVSGGDCEVTYRANAEVVKGDVVLFSGYTTFNQWFSDEFIQRIDCRIDFPRGEVVVNDLHFYVVVPPKRKVEIPKLVEEVYVVKAGDTYNSLSTKFNVPVEELIKLNGKQLNKGSKLKLK